jgi:3-deoxy-D-manno-octulosonate 8-phosphate phosphatase (KDO 8-P phosphatase)
MLEAFRQVRCFVFDVDGVLTDGSILLLDDGQQARRMNIKDGYALQLAIKKGYQILVLTGGASEAVKTRLHKLGVTHVYLNVENKLAKFNQFIESQDINAAQVLFMGDDIPDYSLMKICGLPCCPADAAHEIKNIAKYIASHSGGQGCVREVIEKVLKLNNQWDLDTTVASK